jgi:cell division transport system permease protein
MKKKAFSARLQGHRQAAFFSLEEIYLKPVSSLLAWLIIAIALALPGVLAIVLGNIKQLNTSWQGNVPTLSVYLQPQSEAQQQALQRKIKKLEGVENTQTITPEEALRHLQSVTQLTDLEQVLPKNPLPTVLVVRPEKTAIHEKSLASLKTQLENLEGVDFVQLDMRWVERLLAILEMGEKLTDYLAFLLSAGVLLIVSNTIRLNLMRHRRDIDVLSLIGATAGFIRRPFLYRGLWLGLGGGVIACIIFFLLEFYLGSAVDKVAFLYGSSFKMHGLSVLDSLYVVVVASFLGVLGARLACWRVRPRAEISTK